MPRLRKVKDYDFVVQEVDEDTADTTDSNRTEPSGWWSNENIIASLPDTKLRETLNRHKLLCNLCQSEINRRAQQGVRVSGEEIFDITVGRRVFRQVQRSTRGTVAAPRAKKQRGLTLSAKQMLQALEMLMKMKESK